MIIYVAYRDIYIANGYERTVIGLKIKAKPWEKMLTQNRKNGVNYIFFVRVAIHNEQQPFILYARVYRKMRRMHF